MIDYPSPNARKYGQVQIVSEEQRKRVPIDLIQYTEERCLAKLAMKVHADRYVGLTWPKVERIPLNVLHQEIERDNEWDLVYWQIRVSVTAVPKGEEP